MYRSNILEKDHNYSCYVIENMTYLADSKTQSIHVWPLYIGHITIILGYVP